MTNPDADDFGELVVSYTNDTGDEVEDIQLEFPSAAGATGAPTGTPARVKNFDQSILSLEAFEVGTDGFAKRSVSVKFIGKDRELASVNLTLAVGQTFKHLALDVAGKINIDGTAALEIGGEFAKAGTENGLDTTATGTIRAMFTEVVQTPYFTTTLQSVFQVACSTATPNNTIKQSLTATVEFKGIKLSSYGTLTPSASVSWAFQPDTQSTVTSWSLGATFKSVDYHIGEAILNLVLTGSMGSSTTTTPIQSATIPNSKAEVFLSIFF